MSTTDDTTSTSPAEEQERHSFSDTVASLTGFEEDEIFERFDQHSIGGLMDISLAKAARALLFIIQRRQGVKAGDAYKDVMTKRLADVNAIFFNFNDTDEDKAADDDAKSNDPVTELGKADAPSD